MKLLGERDVRGEARLDHRVVEVAHEGVAVEVERVREVAQIVAVQRSGHLKQRGLNLVVAALALRREQGARLELARGAEHRDVLPDHLHAAILLQQGADGRHEASAERAERVGEDDERDIAERVAGDGVGRVRDPTAECGDRRALRRVQLLVGAGVRAEQGLLRGGPSERRSERKAKGEQQAASAHRASGRLPGWEKAVMAPLHGVMEAGGGGGVRGRRLISAAGAAAMLLAAGALPACSTLQSVQQTFIGGPPQGGSVPRLRGFIGAAVADEPQAALAGREVLALGGTAADAAVAIGMMLTVTLPSRAGLGGGGACLAYDPRKSGAGGGRPEAIMFVPIAPSAPGPETDRPASVPMVARGLFLLQARYGTQPFEALVSPAERLARLGTPVSRALADDIALVAGPLSADPDARAIFAPNGIPLAAGANLVQPDLAVTLAQLRATGVGDLYQGPLADRFVQGVRVAGGGLLVDDLRKALPKATGPITVRAGRDQVAFLPPPADGGLAAAAAFRVLRANPTDIAAAQAVALATASRWRAGGETAETILAHPVTGGASLPALPASTSFVTLDRNGEAVACVETMDNLFGTGRIAQGTGVVLAASPKAVPPPLLSAALAWNDNIEAFRAEVAGSGQEGAALAVADGMANALRSRGPLPAPVPDPGRANAIACWRYLPDSPGTCSWAVDSRSSGLAEAGD